MIITRWSSAGYRDVKDRCVIKGERGWLSRSVSGRSAVSSRSEHAGKIGAAAAGTAALRVGWESSQESRVKTFDQRKESNQSFAAERLGRLQPE